MNVLGAVEAANTVLLAFLTEKLGVSLDQTGPILLEFRAWRQRRRTPQLQINLACIAAFRFG
jgi:hypothetical protein